MKIGYEELCFRPQKSLSMICDALGLEYKKEMLSFSPSLSVSHNLRGNSMRFDENKSNHIQYDYRWIENQGFFKNALLLPVRHFNKENVYSNNFVKNTVSG